MKFKIGKEEVRVYKRLPQDWKIIKGTSTQPAGTVWASNGEPAFKRGKDGKMRVNPKYKQALVVKDEPLLVSRIAENRIYKFDDDRFVTDQVTERKVQSEMRRQRRERKQLEQEREKRFKATEKRLSSKQSAKKPASSCKRKK